MLFLPLFSSLFGCARTQVNTTENTSEPFVSVNVILKSMNYWYVSSLVQI